MKVKLPQVTSFSLGLLLALATALTIGCATPQPTPTSIPVPTTSAVPADWSQLLEWRDTISEAWHKDDTLGINGMGINELDRLIFLDAMPRRGNRDRIEAMLAVTGVPRDAVQVDVGCDTVPDDHLIENVSPTFKETFAYSVGAQPQVQYGETVPLKLVIRNRTSEPAHIYGGANSFGFVVSNKKGENVWYWECGQVYTMQLYSQWVSPSMPLEFTGHWEQIDTMGYPVPPGVYEVIGTFGMDYPERLVTDPVVIEVLSP